MNHEEIKSLLGAYALGAVDEGEARAIEEHLATCPDCPAELSLLTEAASVLALAAVPQQSNPGFSEAVLAAAGTKSGGNVLEFNRPRKRTAVRAALASGIAALLVAVVVLSVATINANNEVARNKAALQSLLHGRQGFHLTGTRGMAAEAVSSGGRARFVVTGLGSAPQGKTYQLWIQRNGKMYSAGTFNTSGDITIARMTGSLDGADGVAVTIEPAGGSDQPTTTPILSS